jgi:predicted nuclease of predicted toxin-antitoxin system
VKLHDFGLLADENIDRQVGGFLRSEGFDVVYAADGRRGESDTQLLETAFKQRRIVVTHERDFGALVIASKQPFFIVLERTDSQIHVRIRQGVP